MPVSTPRAVYDTACSGALIYTYVYTGCDNVTQTWTYTYTITPPTWTLPPVGAETVACASEALTAPTELGGVHVCARVMPESSLTAVYDKACGGTVIYTYVYTGCD